MTTRLPRGLPLGADISRASSPSYSELEADEAREYLESMGLHESGLNRLASEAYSVLGLITFLTAGRRNAAPGPCGAARQRPRPPA